VVSWGDNWPFLRLALHMQIAKGNSISDSEDQDQMFHREFSRPAFVVCVGVLLCATVVSAQTCQSSVNGAYAYSAAGNGTPGGTIPVGAAFSNTGVGQLVAGVTNPAPFASAGTLYFDGSGTIRASNTGLPGVTTTAVGTYILNADCTMTATLTDAFGTNPTVAALQGVVIGSGSEIDLGVLQSSSTGSSNTALGVYQSNVQIKLVRPLATYCTVSNLSGPYVLIAPGARTVAGTATIPTQTVTPFFMFGRVNFDGNGGIVPPPSPASPLSTLQFGGTYTIRTDCTGTITLSGSSTSTSAPTLSLNFALKEGDTLTGPRPEIQFSSSTGTQTLFGEGRAQ
jgi:hypothetical protein